jgi:DNA polymerase-3 subunit gamma/tau
VIEIDAASHGGVDDARDLRERAFYAPVSGRFKVYIIDEAHMVTREGFNALLKLVEEPPPHLKFVFATTEPEKVIPTIRSRTHHYPFRLVPPGVLRELLEEILAAEKVRYEPSVLPLVVRAGAGSVRDSLSVLDQLIAGAGDEGLGYDRTVSLLGYSDDKLLDDIVAALAAGDGAAAFGTVDQVVQSGHDPRRFAADLLDRMRDLIILSAVPGAGKTGLLEAPADRLDRMAEQAERFGQAELARAAEILSDGLIQMRGTASPRLLLELMIAQMLLPGAGTGERALLVRLERLEHLLESGAGSVVTGPPAAAGAGGNQAGMPPRGTPGRAPADQRHAPPDEPPGPSAASTSEPRTSQPSTSQHSRQHSSQHSTSQHGASQPRASQPRASQPGTSQLGGRQPEGRTAAAPGPPGGGQLDVSVLRERWPDVLAVVRGERRLAWIQLQNAVVQSLEDGVLTLGFSSEGVAKGFARGGGDQVLAAALSTLFGLNARIRAAVAQEPGAVPRPPAAGPSASPTPARDPTPGRAGATGPAAGRPDEGGAPAGMRPARPASSPGPGRRRPGPVASEGGAAAHGRPGENDFARQDPPGDPRAEPSPDDPDAESLTGMELIQRHLGGRVIEEIEEA